MNKILKGILKTAEEVGKQVIPGGDLVDEGIHSIINRDVDSGILTVTEGAIKSIEAIKGVDVADDVMFREGVMEIEIGFAKVKAALKHNPSSPVV